MPSKFSKQVANKRLKIIGAARQKSDIVENELMKKLYRLCEQQRGVKSTIEFIEKLESAHLDIKHLNSRKLASQSLTNTISSIRLKDTYIRNSWTRKICKQLEADKKIFTNIKSAGEKLVTIKRSELAKVRDKSAKMDEIIQKINEEVTVAKEILEEIEQVEIERLS